MPPRLTFADSSRDGRAMRSLPVVALVAATLAATLAAMLAVACRAQPRPDDAAHANLVRRLDAVDERLGQLEDGVGGMYKALAAMAQALDELGERGEVVPPPRPEGPDPSVVYSIPIAGDPWKGAKDARVTIVEAGEFA